MKNSQAKRLSEELLNVDQKIVADAFEIDDAKKLKEYIKSKTNEAKKPFYIKPVFRRATAVAACLAIVAVTAFALTKKPDNNISSNNNSETSSQNKKVIYVTGDTADDYYTIVDCLKSLNTKYISPKLQEKMDLYKDYKDTEVVYGVIVEIFIADQDFEAASKLAEATEKALYEQYRVAKEDEQKARAEYNAFCEENPGTEPEIIEKGKEFIEVIEKKRKIRNDLYAKWKNAYEKITDEYINKIIAERFKFAAQFSEKKPVVSSYNSSRYYMDLTGEEINKLAEKGGYIFRLSSNDIMSSDIIL